MLAFIFVASDPLSAEQRAGDHARAGLPAGATLARWWQNSRERLRRKAEMDTNFGRARRIN